MLAVMSAEMVFMEMMSVMMMKKLELKLVLLEVY
jgi:hypothetical protein